MTLELLVSAAVFSTLSTPGSNKAKNIMNCASACQSHGSCGGVVWNATEVSYVSAFHLILLKNSSFSF